MGELVRATGKMTGWIRGLIPVCLGYGLYLGFFPLGPVGTVGLVSMSLEWHQILFARLAFIAATVVAMVFWKAAGGFDLLHRKKRAVWLSFAVALISVAGAYYLVSEANRPWAAIIWQLVFGAALATPKMAYYETFTAIYQTSGRNVCVACLAGCLLVGGITTPLAAVMEIGWNASFVVMACMIALCAVCAEMMSRQPGFSSAIDQGSLREDYHASTYTRTVLLSSGSTWVLTFSVAVSTGFGSGIGHTTTWGVTAAGIVVDVLILVLFLASKKVRNVRFGLMLRVVIAIVGMAWAVMPLLVRAAPSAASFLCSAVYIVQNGLMILFIAEVCTEYRISVCTVATIHYGIFVGSAVVAGMLYYALFSHLEARTAYEAIAAFAVIATLSIIPALPSRSTRGADLALGEIPEDDCFENHLQRAKSELATKCGLTARETEVLDLLVEGRTRDEIASVLAISPWTVKHHVAAIYEKTGIRSVKELVVLLAGGGPEIPKQQ